MQRFRNFAIFNHNPADFERWIDTLQQISTCFDIWKQILSIRKRLLYVAFIQTSAFQ